MSEDALNFLKFFKSYFQHLESFIANPQADCEAMIKLAAVTNMIYSTPYYAAHIAALQPVIMQLLDELGNHAGVNLEPMLLAVKQLEVDNKATMD